MTAAPLVLRNVRRLEWYIRLSTYIVVGTAISGVLFEVARAGRLEVSQIAVFVVMVAHVSANIVLLQRTLAAMKRGETLADVLRSRRGWLAAVVLALGLVAIGLSLDPGQGGGLGLVFVVLMGLAASVTPVLTWRGFLIAMALAVVINTLAGLVLLPGDPAFVLGYSIPTAIALVFYDSTVWLSAWMLRVLWELDDLRQTAPRLAVAEERLRFSRDLHDTFGRTLSVVAVKSELAAELARRGRAEQAADEMAEVRRIAEDAGREVRAVVSGYRRPDLTQELDGARSVLESAGIRCQVRTTGDIPGPRAQSVLGWVVREAVTNVLRHSVATTCSIELTGSAAAIRLVIGNDGAHGSDDRRGNGLLGLTERVHAAGGTLTHDRSGSRFVVTAELPQDSGLAEPVDAPPAHEPAEVAP